MSPPSPPCATTPKLEQLTGQLGSTTSLADALHAQAHEAANRLHTVVTMVELGRTEQPVRFATEELRSATRLNETVVATLEEPAVAALILGKTAQAGERGVSLTLDPEAHGDLIIGTGRSAIGTLVERSSRSTLLVHLPRLDGWGELPYVKNGTSLGGYGAVAMNAALTASITKLPEQLRKTLTWDRGKELSGHALFATETGTRVFFADPHSPWQRPTNENTNGLLRQYFPKGTDLSRWSAEDLEAVAHTLNNRPRKILGWKTPAEVFEEQLRSLQQPGVASTG